MNNFTTTAIRAARLAGEVIIKHYAKLKSSEVHKKGKHDLVTKADLEANEVIIKTIKQQFPGHDFLSEETGFENNPETYTWVIDPLDGTTNYTIRNPLFCTALALIYRNHILTSVIFAPLLKEFYLAGLGRGAFLNKRRIHVSKTRKLPEAIIVVGRSHRRQSHFNSEKIQTKLETSVLNTRRLGSDSMDLAYVACGRVDGCLLVPPQISAWDSVPGVLLVREAGGVVTDFKGREWKPGSEGVVAANKVLQKSLVNLTSKK